MIRKCGSEVIKIENSEIEQPLSNGGNDHPKTNVINSDKSCCVCLNSFLALNLVSKNENGLSLLNKLQINIPQIVSYKTIQCNFI